MVNCQPRTTGKSKVVNTHNHKYYPRRPPNPQQQTTTNKPTNQDTNKQLLTVQVDCWDQILDLLKTYASKVMTAQNVDWVQPQSSSVILQTINICIMTTNCLKTRAKTTPGMSCRPYTIRRTEHLVWYLSKL